MCLRQFKDIMKHDKGKLTFTDCLMRTMYEKYCEVTCQHKDWIQHKLEYTV